MEWSISFVQKRPKNGFSSVAQTAKKLKNRLTLNSSRVSQTFLVRGQGCQSTQRALCKHSESIQKAPRSHSGCSQIPLCLLEICLLCSVVALNVSPCHLITAHLLLSLTEIGNWLLAPALAMPGPGSRGPASLDPGHHNTNNESPQS